MLDDLSHHAAPALRVVETTEQQWQCRWGMHTYDEHATRATGEIGVLVDVTGEDAVQAAVARTVDALGPIDHLVHAAAIG